MKNDEFSRFHPVANLLFFVGAIVFDVLIIHPIYLAVGVIFSGTYYFLLNGKKGLKTALWLFVMFVLLTLLNPVINTRGKTVLFLLFGRPYTLEALIYGGCIVSVLVIMILWLGCFSKVLTADKFIGIFGNFIPSLSMLLVMIFRMIPTLFTKKKQAVEARYTIGCASGGSLSDRLHSGITTLSVMSSCALEGSVVTADSMRARGYGCGKRSSFTVYRFTVRDGVMTAAVLILAAVVAVFIARGAVSANFLPSVDISRVSGVNVIGLAGYCLYLFIPIGLYFKEAVRWNISISKI